MYYTGYLTYPATKERNQTLYFHHMTKILLDTSEDDSLCNHLPPLKIHVSKVYFKIGQSALSISQPKTTVRLIFFYKGIKFKFLKLAIVSPEALLYGPIQSSIV